MTAAPSTTYQPGALLPPTVSAQLGLGDVVAVTDGATINPNCKDGSSFSVTLGGNRTVTFVNQQPGQLVELYVTQDGTGSRTVTWTNFIWAAATAPTLTVTAGATDRISGRWNATLGKWVGTSTLALG